MSNYKSDQDKLGQIYGWHVYLIREVGAAKFCKIGSAFDVVRRVSKLQGGNPRRLELVGSWHLDDRFQARAVEAAVLQELAGYRLPLSEWFQCRPELVAATAESAIQKVGAVLRSDTGPRWK